MKIKILLFFILIFTIIFINSCENKMALPESALGNCDTIGLTYSSGPNQMKPIIDAQCGTSNSSCHAPRGVSGYDYSTYSSALVGNCQNGTLISCLFLGTPFQMPQTPQPGWSDSSACMLAKFKAWVNQGYKQ